MKSILSLNSSIFGDGGQSSLLAEQFIAQFPAARVVRRDLSKEPVPHLDAQRFGAFLSKPESRTPAQQQVLNDSDALVAELKEADTLVIGLPMYNFGIPSQLKAYFDHVARAGVTFKYTDKGAVGLLTGKKAYVFAARGGLYQGTPRDTQTAYVREFLAFLGITEVQFVYAEGLAISEASKVAALASAQSVLRNLAQPERIAA
jgi:FMN-dependent NADH-azoreductase